MNRTLATLILTAGVFATLGVSSLKAQERAVAVIPFAFHVKSQVMPAGKYELSNLSSSDHFLLKITDYQGHTSLVNSIPAGVAKPEDPKLTFACYSGECRLVKMDLPGSSVSHKVPTDASYKVGMAAMIRIRVSH